MCELEVPTRTEQIYAFTSMEAEGQGWDPVELA